ncbi:liprin-beta-2b isoform X2 [Electrophorus electricus]|uniref:liprin-beta-2b isoform X2 n=1 Tax=Electrophorus electricus TaxID=8005 RepID=UPI0015CFCD08|nr:liprin-beta-2b isoform X2 [Electrophorus electricus]
MGVAIPTMPGCKRQRSENVQVQHHGCPSDAQTGQMAPTDPRNEEKGRDHPLQGRDSADKQHSQGRRSPSMAADASLMLEAALEQMDDIIAGSKAVTELTNGLCELGSPIDVGSLQALQLAEELRLALELQEDGDRGREALRSRLPCSTSHALLEWLERGTVSSQSPSNNETHQERLERLEGDKESLVLQVSVLTEQVEAQGEKIRDLEASLEENSDKLLSTEEMLQQELLSRTSLETQKLDLMDEVSCLKLKLVSMEEEQDPAHRDDKQRKAECVVNVISELQEQMRKFQKEISTRIQEQRAQEAQEAQGARGEGGAPRQARDRSPDVGLGSSDAEDVGCRCGAAGDNQALLQELRVLKTKVDELESEKLQYDRTLKATKMEISELQQLLVSKDAEIKSLQNQLLSKGPFSSNSTERDLELQRLKAGIASLLTANNEKDRHIEELMALLDRVGMAKDTMVLSPGCVDSGSSEEDLHRPLKPRPLPRKAHSDIVHSGLQVSSAHGQSHCLPPGILPKDLDSNCYSMQNSLEISVSCLDDPGFYNGQWLTQKMLSASLEELQSRSRQKYELGQPVEPVLENRHVSNSSRYRTLPGKMPPLAPLITEREDSGVNLRKEKAGESAPSDLSDSPENKKSERGIRRLWGKIKRTQSGSFRADSLPHGDFKRRGVRSTTGPSVAHMGDTAHDVNTPFSKWSCDQVCVWLEDYGLGQYIPMAKQWVSSGQTLLSASPHDFEKELGIKHPLHRKKLQLGLHAISSASSETSAKLDHVWVTRWLDDIGLPQYKDQFHEARVDGRMLQYLTVDDLLLLKVSSQLHHLSIKCAIRVLHANKFNPNCLKRRPGEESQPSPSEVMQWSNHRVMEWLRAVDLAEYAPNLRGSGVHGGLIILEQSFNEESLAVLLSIPPQKTLLRRHLATNFHSLVGAQAQRDKVHFLESPGYAPLSTTAKVRPKKLGFSGFSHLRKKRPDDSTDYVCPLEPLQDESLRNGTRQPRTDLGPVQDGDTEGREQVGPPLC